MERVPTAAFGCRPAAGAGGAGGRLGPGFYREAVPDVEAVEPVPLCEAERCLLCLALHGLIWLCSAAAGKPGEDAVEA